MTATAILRTCNVYGLYSSLGGGIRYVGQTTMGVARRTGHHVALALRNKTQTHRDHWIRKVISEGGEIKWSVLESGASWNSSEIKWIKKLIRGGASLTNSTKGGEGMLNAPKELRDRISSKVKLLWADPEYRQRMKDAHSGANWSAARRSANDKTDPEIRSKRAKAGKASMSKERVSEISSVAARKSWEKKRANGTDRGEHCNSAKLSSSDVIEIRRQLEIGTPKAELGRRFGVAPASIRGISTGRTWSHIV